MASVVKLNLYYRYGLTPTTERPSQDDSVMLTYRNGELTLLVEVHPDNRIAVVVHNKRVVIHWEDIGKYGFGSTVSIFSQRSDRC